MRSASSHCKPPRSKYEPHATESSRGKHVGMANGPSGTEDGAPNLFLQAAASVIRFLLKRALAPGEMCWNSELVKAVFTLFAACFQPSDTVLPQPFAYQTFTADL